MRMLWKALRFLFSFSSRLLGGAGKSSRDFAEFSMSRFLAAIFARARSLAVNPLDKKGDPASDLFDLSLSKFCRANSGLESQANA